MNSKLVPPGLGPPREKQFQPLKISKQPGALKISSGTAEMLNSSSQENADIRGSLQSAAFDHNNSSALNEASAVRTSNSLATNYA